MCKTGMIVLATALMTAGCSTYQDKHGNQTNATGVIKTCEPAANQARVEIYASGKYASASQDERYKAGQAAAGAALRRCIEERGFKKVQ